MFGHDKADDNTDSQVMTPTEPVQSDTDDNTELTLPVPEPAAADDSSMASAAPVADEPTAAPDEPATEEPEEVETAPETTEAEPEEAPAEDTDAVEAATAAVGGSSSYSPTSDLASLKEAALKELSPLVGHLDQPPEEKLKTIMMLYEATKDQGLLKEAHEAAIALSDDTARAKALLDLVQTIDEASA